MNEAPQYAAAWNSINQYLPEVNILDLKTSTLVYSAVLAALGIESGIPFHVQTSKDIGSSHD